MKQQHIPHSFGSAAQIGFGKLFLNQTQQIFLKVEFIVTKELTLLYNKIETHLKKSLRLLELMNGHQAKNEMNLEKVNDSSTELSESTQ